MKFCFQENIQFINIYNSHQTCEPDLEFRDVNFNKPSQDQTWKIKIQTDSQNLMIWPFKLEGTQLFECYNINIR